MTSVCVAQVPFTKRKTGLLKKAREPSILCDCESAVHNTNGRCFEFASGDTSRTLTRFATFQGTVELRGWQRYAIVTRCCAGSSCACVLAAAAAGRVQAAVGGRRGADDD